MGEELHGDKTAAHDPTLITDDDASLPAAPEDHSATDDLPPPPSTPTGDLATQIEQLRREVQTNLDGWQRSRAEFTNYKRRTERDMKDLRERTSLDTLTKLLPIVDDFERALGNIPADLKDHAWVNGTTLILRKFEKLLEEYHIVPLDPVGEWFDPNRHTAIGAADSDQYESGRVIETLQKGYLSGERILRPALVRVAN